jgi:hypothetical protein
MTASRLKLLPVDESTVSPQLAGVLNPKLDTSGGLVSVRELLADAQCFSVVDDDGEQVASYALRVCQHDAGNEAVIVAAVGGAPGVCLVSSVMPGIEAQAKNAGCIQVSMYTRRRGLLAKLRAQGFEFGGYVMRKKL